LTKSQKGVNEEVAEQIEVRINIIDRVREWTEIASHGAAPCFSMTTLTTI